MKKGFSITQIMYILQWPQIGSEWKPGFNTRQTPISKGKGTGAPHAPSHMKGKSTHNLNILFWSPVEFLFNYKDDPTVAFPLNSDENRKWIDWQINLEKLSNELPWQFIGSLFVHATIRLLANSFY